MTDPNIIEALNEINNGIWWMRFSAVMTYGMVLVGIIKLISVAEKIAKYTKRRSA